MFLVGHTATAPLWPASDLSGHFGTHMPMDKGVASCNGGGGACIARGVVTPPRQFPDYVTAHAQGMP